MKGKKDDLAVLCIKDKTYEVRTAETSNTLLLAPDCTLPKDEKDANSTITGRHVSSFIFIPA